MNLIDIGVNLTHKSFEADQEKVIQNAAQAGVTSMVLTGTSLFESKEALETALEYENIYSTAGVHPHDVKHCKDDTIEELEKLLSNERCVAVGECGLDYNRNFSPQDVQRTWFAQQIQLANKVKKPLFLHERDAFDDFYQILSSEKEDDIKAVVHCFTGSLESMKAYLDQGWYIGITGWICDERRGLGLREIIKYIPADRLMLETDAPFLTPRDMRPKPKKGRNEPAFLVHIAMSFAEAIGKPVEQLAEETLNTTKEFFGI